MNAEDPSRTEPPDNRSDSSERIQKAEQSAAAADPFATESQDFAPSQLGRYRFIRPLAAGGLGVVSIYFDTELNRQVALKEIRGDCADDNLQRQSFCVEAEVTGLLEHPGVVPIYGMGTGSDGRPYYAMRLISGDELRGPIRDFHNAIRRGVESLRGPRLRQLLQRLIDVCNVMHYAHCRGVIHRDLKSVNVMVGRYGETLVIDWGLAKTTGSCEVDDIDADDSSDTVTERPIAVNGTDDRHSRHGRMMGTIAYAPPEQLNGNTDAIDATSDCYAIGAILYEILTGDPPCKGMSVAAAIRAIEGKRIPTPHELNREVPKPLSAIAVKAMSADRRDRYATAKDLRNDLQKWLDDQPVHAYQESLWERLSRWKRQHETFVRWATFSLVLVTLISLAAAYVINLAKNQQQKARQEATALYQLARGATDDLLTTTGDRLESIPDTTDVREELLRNAEESLRAMAQFRTDDPELRRESARAGIRLADVRKKLGRKNDAIASLVEARRSISALRDITDEVLRARTFIEESRVHGNDTQADIASASEAANRAIQVTAELVRQPDPSSDVLLAHAEAQIQIGVVAVDLGVEDAAQSFLNAAASIRKTLAAESDAGRIREARLQLIRALNNGAAMLPGDSPQTPILFQSAIEAANESQAIDPGDLQIAIERGKVLNNYGDFLLEERHEVVAAEQRYQETADEFSKLSGEYPAIADYKEFLVLSLVGLAKVAFDRGDREAAILRSTEASEMANLLIGQNANRINFLLTAAQAHGLLGEVLMESDVATAKTELASASQLLSPLVRSHANVADEAWYHESKLLQLLANDLYDAKKGDALVRLANYVQQTASLATANAQYTVACLISQQCETIEDVVAQNQYLDIAATRLRLAAEARPELQSIAHEDEELQFLMARRPLVFSKH